MENILFLHSSEAMLCDLARSLALSIVQILNNYFTSYYTKEAVAHQIKAPKPTLHHELI
jgi:hypothetical protein